MTDGMRLDTTFSEELDSAIHDTLEYKLGHLLNNCKEDMQLAQEVASIQGNQFTFNVFGEIYRDLNEPYFIQT